MIDTGLNRVEGQPNHSPRVTVGKHTTGSIPNPTASADHGGVSNSHKIGRCRPWTRLGRGVSLDDDGRVTEEAGPHADGDSGSR